MENNWVLINPSRKSGSSSINNEKVKVSFFKFKSKSKTQREYFVINLQIGKEIADKISIDKGSKVDLFIENGNEKKILIKKNTTGLNSYKIYTSTDQGYRKVQLTWRFSPETPLKYLGKGSKEINFELSEDNQELKLFLE